MFIRKNSPATALSVNHWTLKLSAIVLVITATFLFNFFVTPPSHAQSGATLDSEEQAFLVLINNYRQQNGLVALQASTSLNTASDWMSNDMAQKNYFSHTDSLGRDPFTRMRSFGYNYNTYMGENIAAGYSDAASTFNQWKNSPGHNQNMLNPNYRVIGIGRVANLSATYRYYWTTDFGGYVDSVTTPTPTPTPTPVPTPTPTPVPTPNPTPTPTPTTPVETVWFDDAVPTGAGIGGTNEGWRWISANPSPFSGALSHQSGVVNGMHQHYFVGATKRLSIGVGEKIFTDVYLDPSFPPSEIMFQWSEGTTWKRAYWGANVFFPGQESTTNRYVGPLPATGKWVRLEVPASQLGLEGTSLNGMAFTLFNGRATFDRTGKTK